MLSQTIRVHEDGRFLCLEDGEPFFWLGDTAWELLEKCSDDEVEHYLTSRHAQGYNVIQTVAVMTVPEVADDPARCAIALPKGAPFDTARLHEAYWQRMDRLIARAASLNMIVALLPCWGDKINKMPYHGGPEIFTPETGALYGQWLGARYADTPNLVFILGGDTPIYYRRHHETVLAIAEGIRREERVRHLLSFHPPGKQSSAKNHHEEAWLDFNMLQSSHSVLDMKTHAMVQHDWALSPAKPVLDGEPCYEDHPFNFAPENGYLDAANTRKAAYWAVLAGACGHTYGHHSVWHMATEVDAYFIMTWRQALDRPGARQMRYLKDMVLSRPYFERRPAQDMLAENYEGSNALVAMAGNAYAYVYTPNGLRITVRLGRLPGGQLRATWMNPRDGTQTACGTVENVGEHAFAPPTSGRGEDWVLMLDSIV